MVRSFPQHLWPTEDGSILSHISSNLAKFHTNQATNVHYNRMRRAFLGGFGPVCCEIEKYEYFRLEFEQRLVHLFCMGTETVRAYTAYIELGSANQEVNPTVF